MVRGCIACALTKLARTTRRSGVQKSALVGQHVISATPIPFGGGGRDAPGRVTSIRSTLNTRLRQSSIQETRSPSRTAPRPEK